MDGVNRIRDTARPEPQASLIDEVILHRFPKILEALRMDELIEALMGKANALNMQHFTRWVGKRSLCQKCTRHRDG